MTRVEAIQRDPWQETGWKSRGSRHGKAWVWVGRNSLHLCAKKWAAYLINGNTLNLPHIRGPTSVGTAEGTGNNPNHELRHVLRLRLTLKLPSERNKSEVSWRWVQKINRKSIHSSWDRARHMGVMWVCPMAHCQGIVPPLVYDSCPSLILPLYGHTTWKDMIDHDRHVLVSW